MKQRIWAGALQPHDYICSMIRYGFACKALGVPHTSQTTLTLARADGGNLVRVGRHNLHALGAMLNYCRQEQIALMRISSDVIPLAAHPKLSFDWRTYLREELDHVRSVLAGSGVRVSMHPGQYTILNSPREEVCEHAVRDLMFHADFLDAIGADATAKIILHVGGGYGDRHAAMSRLVATLPRVPQHVRARLAFENDERIYTIADVLDVCTRFSLPAVFDVHHHALNAPEQGSMEYWLDAALASWNSHSGRPKIHYSQALPGGRHGAHSHSIASQEFLDFHRTLGDRNLDVMLEVKDKNLSAIKCTNLTNPHLPRARLNEEWARYKYLVLEHAPTIYTAIRTFLKAERPAAAPFYALVEEALRQQVTPEHARNAAQHVWGYMDTLATPGEAQRILGDIRGLHPNCATLPRLKRRLLALAEQHAQTYLTNSLYLYL